MRRTLDAWVHSWALSLAALGALALAGCPETASCPSDRPIREGGECRAATPPDGGNDAGADAGNDAGSDAGPPCGVVCEAPEPYCDTTASSPECRQCLMSSHCTALTPVCAGGSCGGCTSPTDCAGFAATPYCHMSSGECRACDLASEVEFCGGNWCDPTTGLCTDTPRGMVEDCASCATDAQCSRGSFCIETQYASVPQGSFCFPTTPDVAGCLREAFSWRPDTMSVDGSVVNACMITESLTTCVALNNHLTREPCTIDGMCGTSGVCHPLGLCSYRCSGTPRQCPEGCGGGGERLCTPPPP